MEMTDLNKNITEILTEKYIVPLYQRNFAWGFEEINQLLQDIYDSFNKKQEGDYFIGSLIVLKRDNGDFEVIDGQQRLTAITLIAKSLNIDTAKEPKLFYDSRPEVEAFFKSFYETGEVDRSASNDKIHHLVNAVDIINDIINNIKLSNHIDANVTIQTPKNEMSFKKFFSEKVIIVRVEVPEDTDVANYFEIMNNRGEQLKKHEILKARLLSKIEDDTLRATCAKIWDACSQMNEYIHKPFNINDRKKLFGDEYNLCPQKIVAISESNDNSAQKYSLADILKNNQTIDDGKNDHSKTKEKEKVEVEDGDESSKKSIIDFPNFLMHILKLLYNSEIPLNDKDLLTAFDKIENKVDTVEFISKLFYYRVVFDRYIIKATYDEHDEEKYKWTLKNITITEKNNVKKGYSYKDTFDDQKRIVKCLSMLQVSYGGKTYKHWLQEVLSWFSNNDEFNMTGENYQKKLDKLVLQYYEKTIGNEIKEVEHIVTNTDYYSKGTGTPHFLFNLIDYLYWVESQNDGKNKFNFEFKYRNSVEHHKPQSDEKAIDDKIIHCLGNLCLVNTSTNSQMSNNDPSKKAKDHYSKNLPPKRKIMYEMTMNSKSKPSWSEEEIKQHYKDVVSLLERKEKILGIDE